MGQWNLDKPQLNVDVHDRILSVNGVSGDPAFVTMHALCVVPGNRARVCQVLFLFFTLLVSVGEPGPIQHKLRMCMYGTRQVSNKAAP